MNWSNMNQLMCKEILINMQLRVYVKRNYKLYLFSNLAVYLDSIYFLVNSFNMINTHLQFIYFLPKRAITKANNGECQNVEKQCKRGMDQATNSYWLINIKVHR